ncbi:hypothetical protein FQR65_LT12982 [Abscondita terminalis]|nr:hypothetical protein FQR65_LT12982 [Abscondita terminalis]
MLRTIINKKCIQVFLRRQLCSVGINLENLHNKFNEEQQQEIIHTLNKSDSDRLAQLGIPLNRVKSIKTWQHKHGRFENLADVLDVDGLGIKVLEKICSQIISNETVAAPVKNRKQYLSPPLTNELSENISCVVGLHLGPAGISWAKVSKDNQLMNWNFFKFNEVSKKAMPIDTFKLVQTIMVDIPPSDVYVFEQAPHRPGLGSTQNISHGQNLEILSMLLALINTSPIYNVNQSENCVYYLRSNLSARLFRTLMGTERVSSTAAVNHLMEGVTTDDFPCSVIVDTKFKDDYLSKNAISKELLGQALLLVVAFMEICVHKNPKSLSIVSRGSNNKKHELENKIIVEGFGG